MDSLIPIVNKLQEVVSLSGIKTGIDLPRIIVVGSQSSGKSSVLESIVGTDFLPRGTGIVTRCPLILRLIRTNTENDYAMFSHLDGCVFSDFSDVTKEIIAISKEIAETEGVSSREIFLNIYSRSIVDLTLIDLPGLIKVPLKGQVSNLDQKINNMIADYARQENSIILAISPANSDIANSDSLCVARQVDPEGNRTIGVITKIDLMDRGTNALEMIEGKLYPLKLGYVGVVCRSQEDINNKVPMDVHMKKEKEFFTSSKVYKHMASRLGIDYLSNRLNAIFKGHLQNTVPKLKREIGISLENVNKQLADIGEIPMSLEMKNEAMYSIIIAFCNSYKNSLYGNSIENITSELSGGSIIRKIFKDFFKDICEKTDPLAELSDFQIRISIMNAMGAKGVMFVPEAAFENLLYNIIQGLKMPCLSCLGVVREELQKILNSIKISEFKRYPRLKDLCISFGYEILDECMPFAEKYIESIIEIESNYINIYHPDFISPTDAMSIARRMTEEIAKRPKNERPEKQVKENSGLFSNFFRSKAERVELKFEEVGKNDKKLNSILSEEMSAKELEQNNLIRILIENYFNIVKYNIGDCVPKSIMRNLVIKSNDNLQKKIVAKLYQNQEIYEQMFQEDPQIQQQRKNLRELQKCMASALDILKDVIT